MSSIIVEEPTLPMWLSTTKGDVLNTSARASPNRRTILHLDPNFIRQVQQIFAFREVIGSTSNFETSILVRTGSQGAYPISFREPQINYMTSKPILSKTIMNKWFLDTTTAEIISDMFSSDDPVETIIIRFRFEVEKIITRVDKELISIAGTITEQLMNRLQEHRSSQEPNQSNDG
jgi:hypothetical protein